MVFGGMSRSEDSLVTQTASSQALREALGSVYSSQARFQTGSMNDSWEAHVAILDTLQEELVAPASGGGGGTAVQAAFQLELADMACCVPTHMGGCGERVETMKFETFVIHATTPVLQQAAARNRSMNFDELVKVAREERAGSCRTEGCAKKGLRKEQELRNHPGVVTVGLVWASARAPRETINAVLDSIDPYIDVHKMFCRPATAARREEVVAARLRGMFCYYGQHYVACFYNSDVGQWLTFDDAKVRRVGPHWRDALEKIRRGRLQPSLLFYEVLPAGTEIPQGRGRQTLDEEANGGGGGGGDDGGGGDAAANSGAWGANAAAASPGLGGETLAQRIGQKRSAYNEHTGEWESEPTRAPQPLPLVVGGASENALPSTWAAPRDSTAPPSYESATTEQPGGNGEDEPAPAIALAVPVARALSPKKTAARKRNTAARPRVGKKVSRADSAPLGAKPAATRPEPGNAVLRADSAPLVVKPNIAQQKGLRPKKMKRASSVPSSSGRPNSGHPKMKAHPGDFLSDKKFLRWKRQGVCHQLFANGTCRARGRKGCKFAHPTAEEAPEYYAAWAAAKIKVRNVSSRRKNEEK
jgi:hypothetical protein